MLVRFRVNLGSHDARRHGLDFSRCCKGVECDVADRSGQWLVSRGIAVEVPKVVKGIPDQPSLVAAESELINTDVNQESRQHKKRR